MSGNHYSPHGNNDKEKGILISAIIPVYNSSSTFTQCLDGLFSSDYNNYEVLVVDDQSSDSSTEIARNYPCKIIQMETNSGAATARNRGVTEAYGDILLFIDADIVVKPDTLTKLHKRFANSNEAAIVGLLTKETKHNNFFSQFENLYTHYVFCRKERSVAFYTSIAAIKKKVFEKVGGFDSNYAGATIEDHEFGVRMGKLGIQPLVAHDIEVFHLKFFSFKSLLNKNFKKSNGFIKMFLRSKKKRLLEKQVHRKELIRNMDFLISIFLTLSLLPLAFFSFFAPAFLILLSAIYFLITILNLKYLSFVRREKGLLFFIKSILFLIPNLLIYGLGLIYGTITFLLGVEY